MSRSPYARMFRLCDLGGTLINLDSVTRIVHEREGCRIEFDGGGYHEATREEGTKVLNALDRQGWPHARDAGGGTA